MAEAPIRDLEPIGGDMDKKGGGFRAKDRKLLSNPNAISKIRRQWENTDFVFDIYLLKVPSLNKQEYREYGIISPGDSAWKDIEEATGNPVPNSGDAITILFNGNYGSEKVPMTGWVMAHRLGHAVRTGRGVQAWAEYIKNVQEIVKMAVEEIYEIQLKFSYKYMGNGEENSFEPDSNEIARQVFQQLGSFKSARDKKITRPYEFYYELFAQYLITGEIKFNPFPKELIVGSLPYGRKDTRHVKYEESLEMWNRDLEIYAGDIESRIANVLHSIVGKTLLM